ncbi:MAG TPA: TIM44-like domain-containing protein [Thermoanaerobaculia bacterium]|nr:TIM44-like domain-containing protein [Thermoanaerobaculia bacterium]
MLIRGRKAEGRGREQRPSFALCPLRTALWAALLAWPIVVFARVGGGESYSGGGGSSDGGGGGGGDGAGELLYLLFRFLLWLTIEYPAIGIPVDIVVIILLIKWWRAKQSSAPALLRISTQKPSLDDLRRFDPNFSEITFSDFCYSVYALAHYARGKGDLARYAPYLSVVARNTLEKRGGGQALLPVHAVIVAACNVTAFSGVDGPTVTATVRYESNITEGETAFYLQEQWVLERRRDILSPPPEKAKADHCPRCGAALQTRTDGSCDYCGVKIESGAFQWYVRTITLLSREVRGPLLTSNVPEQGTDRATIYQPRFAQTKATFEAEHPGFAWESFEKRARAIAHELQDAWTARDWERVRPLETESLFQFHRYWIDAYRRQNLRNIVDDFAITRIEPVKISSDAFYEAITVRLWAQGRDHTDDANGKVAGGSKTQMRYWTEYWTFIRTKITVSAAIACPNCGASVHAGATGVCNYCGGKITVGHFEWILSRIEQDESYGG